MVGFTESGLLAAGDLYLLPDGAYFLGKFAQPSFNSVSRTPQNYIVV